MASSGGSGGKAEASGDGAAAEDALHLAQRSTLESVEQQVSDPTAERDALRRRLIGAEEAERKRLSRELHDQLGQELTAFRLGLDDAARLLSDAASRSGSSDRRALDRIEQLQLLAERLMRGARYVALELRPPELDDVGLESALDTYVREWSARYGVDAEFTAIGSPVSKDFPADVASTIYRIAQEALTNVAKHARARHVSVIIEPTDGEIRLVIEDNGQGFDVSSASENGHRDRRLGVSGMRERAALVGGTLDVESSPGQGTAVYLRVGIGPAWPAGSR